MKRHATIAGLLFALLTAATMARATVGGPMLSRILGWDRSTDRLYFMMDPRDEADPVPSVWYFDLRSRSPERPVRSRLAAPPNRDEQRLTGFPRQLESLPMVAASSMIWDRQVELQDSLPTIDGPRARFEIRVHVWLDEGQATAVVTCFDSPEVRLLSVHRVPGRSMAIAVLSYTGDVAEGGYEVQPPILLTAAGPTTRHIGERGMP